MFLIKALDKNELKNLIEKINSKYQHFHYNAKSLLKLPINSN